MSQRVPKRPVNKYDGKTYIDCEHDLPIRHIKKRGKWIPYVSCFILLYYYTYFYYRVIHVKTPLTLFRMMMR